MAMTDKLKEMVDELKHDVSELKDQLKELLPSKRSGSELAVHRTENEHPIVSLQRETNRLFDEFLRGSPMNPVGFVLGTLDVLMNGGWPRLDVDESEREFRITADLAGMERDEIDLAVADGMLTIRGEKRSEDEDLGRHHYRRECFYGSFSRSVPIPVDADVDKIKAKMKNGVLKVSMPKLGDRGLRGRRITID